MGLNGIQKIVFIIVALVVLIIAWCIFPLFFKWVMGEIGAKETELKDFGALGDIYGSLNTLFTSVTLLIVMYSAYLQRKANKESKDLTRKQLE